MTTATKGRLVVTRFKPRTGLLNCSDFYREVNRIKSRKSTNVSLQCDDEELQFFKKYTSFIVFKSMDLKIANI